MASLGIVQGEHALGRIEFSEQAGVKMLAPEAQTGVEPPPQRDETGRVLQGVPRVALAQKSSTSRRVRWRRRSGWSS